VDTAELQIDGRAYTLSAQTRIATEPGVTAPGVQQLLQTLLPGTPVLYQQRGGQLLSLELLQRELTDMPRAVLLPQGEQR
jgi:hypothetical protein